MEAAGSPCCAFFPHSIIARLSPIGQDTRPIGHQGLHGLLCAPLRRRGPLTSNSPHICTHNSGEKEPRRVAKPHMFRSEMRYLPSRVVITNRRGPCGGRLAPDGAQSTPISTRCSSQFPCPLHRQLQCGLVVISRAVVFLLYSVIIYHIGLFCILSPLDHSRW